MAIEQPHDYLFSIIVPVYNVEDFLEEALESIASQVGGYFARTEVIVVDDGSTDGSLRIAQRFAQKFPENIVVIHQENQGVSTAKNTGIERARGQYLGFLDSDDRYQRHLLKNVALFFDTVSESETDVVAFPMRFFEAQTGEHRLNNKFKDGLRVIDVREDWQDVQLSSASTFVRKSCIDALNLRFNTEVILGEDAAFITEAIMRKQRFGVINTAYYEYRKRRQGGSAIDSFQKNPKSYTPVLEHAWVRLFNQFDHDGTVPKYVQNVACHDMEWRLKQTEQHALSDEEYHKYWKMLTHILTRIDDDVILSQRFFGAIHKVYALSIKYGEDPREVGRYHGTDFIYRGRKLWTAARSSFNYQVDALTYSDSTLHLHGRFTGFSSPQVQFGAFVEGEFVPATIEPTPKYRRIINNGTVVFEPVIASFDVLLRPGQKISFGVSIAGEYIDGVLISFLNTSRLSNFPRSYRVFKEAIVANGAREALYIQPRSLFNHAKREVMHVRKMAWAMFKGKTLSPSIPAYRLAAKVGKAVKRKEIWILSDRPYAAGDNGEALFRYLVDHKPPKTHLFFNIKKTAADYPALAQLGNVIDQETTIGKLLFLLSDEVISSQADEIVINAFGKDRQGVMDLYDFNFRFLQHGITKDDLSSWLNKYTKDIKTFVTASPHEYHSIIEGDYDYTENEVTLSGFPRFDLLRNTPTQKIVVAPTWRKALAGNVDPETGMRAYSPDFQRSAYFEFYQALMLDGRLNECLRKNGFTAELYLHPNHLANTSDFTETDVFTVSQPPHNYKEMFASAAALVTDYSSVAFDFAYLRKPVIYTQFDAAKFFATQGYSQGYFDYHKHGFGPVVSDIDAAVDALVALIDNGCSLDSTYLGRIDDFFAYSDRNNCERVAATIMESRRSK
ncbi:MAG: CDP-glycerol glycerophosphotransferase family protein [Actinomycetaceae bacterium]|nr:CDP-glycerol glycerophosphotransferase family protein [Actinomycetaceae bacterium]MDY5855157.1 CDP-glycerol glycerophosphotransferase family protein [Arcanobacterium sp.]